MDHYKLVTASGSSVIDGASSVYDLTSDAMVHLFAVVFVTEMIPLTQRENEW